MDCNLIKEWSRRYLINEGKYDPSMENPDDYKSDLTFKKADEYEEWMKERERLMQEFDPKSKVNEDEEEEEVEEIDVMEEVRTSKDKLIENLEKALENREERSEDEIKEVLTLLNLLDPEKLSDEDKALLNPPSDEEETTEVDSTEDEVEKEEEK